MCCHVHQPWTWLFISYRDWFNTAVTPWGFWKAQWDLWDSASLLDTLRDALCVQISLLGLRPSHQAKRNLWPLQSNSVPEQSAGSGRWAWEAQRGTGREFLPSTVHSRDNICRASSGWSAGHRCWTYPTCPTEESLHLHLLHQYFAKAWVEKDWAYGKGGFRDISGQAFKAHFLAPFPHVSMRTTMNSQPSWSGPEPTQENPRRRVSVPDCF